MIAYISVHSPLDTFLTVPIVMMPMSIYSPEQQSYAIKPMTTAMGALMTMRSTILLSTSTLMGMVLVMQA